MNRKSRHSRARQPLLAHRAVGVVAAFSISVCVAFHAAAPAGACDELKERFANPPQRYGTWVYWWWLDGYVSREGIVRELDAMREKGISGALIFQAGKGGTPRQTKFMSDAWREYFRFAVEEAAKRGIEITLNICDGWDAGGPWMTAEHAPMMLQSSRLAVEGPGRLEQILPELPVTRRRQIDNLPIEARSERELVHGDVCVYAWQMRTGNVCASETFRDISGSVDAEGHIRWEIPDGRWQIVRFGWYIRDPQGYIQNGAIPGKRYSTYFAVNELDREAMDLHFEQTAKILVEDVRPYVGSTFTHLHIDSAETGHPTWTHGFLDHFERLRGYDPRPYLAAKEGHVVDRVAITGRFREDYYRTLADLNVEAYYGRLDQLAAEYGLGTHSEAAGPQGPNVDALRTQGLGDIVMSEFWSRDGTGVINNQVQTRLAAHDDIRNAASAAHIYGKRIIQAEAYTTARPNFSMPLYGLKDIGDRAFCQGLNRTVLHHFVHQAETDRNVPGYFWPGIGKSFTVNATWWPWSEAWFSYLNRCHMMLQTGTFVADVAYLQGETAPMYAPPKWAMDPSLPLSYDCDTINADALTRLAEVDSDGRLVVPGGVAYRYLVLSQAGLWKRSHDKRAPHTIFQPPEKASGHPIALSPKTLRRIRDMVRQGLTLVGPPKVRAVGLSDFPACDAEIRSLTQELWGEQAGSSGRRDVGAGRVIWGERLADILASDGVLPDLEYEEDEATAALPVPPEVGPGLGDPIGFDWIHHHTGEVDFYFIANLRNSEAKATFRFRQRDRQPELFDPLTGEVRDLPEWKLTEDGRIAAAMTFAPRQSFFVVFRRPPAKSDLPVASNFPDGTQVLELTGPWNVAFDPAWGGADSIVFDGLVDWSTHLDERIKYYSGRASYTRSFHLKESALSADTAAYLDLGQVEVMARVIVNGQQCGTVWTAPWQVDISSAVRHGENSLVVEVVNLWRNRLIGDRTLPEDERLTFANFQLHPGEDPLPSGLLGPVRVMQYPQ